MDEVALERRMTEMDQRSKSNQHRLDKLEPIVGEIRTMSETMVRLVEEVRHTNENVNCLNTKVDRMDSRVDEMEKAPAVEWKSTKKKAVDTAIGVIVGFVMAGIMWAAVQAF